MKMSGSPQKPQEAPGNSQKPQETPGSSQKPAEAPVVSSAAKIRAKLDAEAEEANQKDAQFSRMQKLAVQRSQFHVNKSMGSKGNADQPHKAWTGKETTRYVSENDDSSDGGWSDDD